ncbi:hypothetical protein F4820DRAFT_466424 [Hypoxylon rubiginosum]|uniref:Uncharacterized protein n=1 Tax=Hypoxylon rubiginosum TaxID=110542 RepID=A0ACB9YLB1_9PEZI|nr:hypothetical protein F4820DRAFT_466424 [Hypoxylon rubiginosum]
MADAWPTYEATAHPKLESLPAELINETVKYLEPKDIGSLRLANRNICGKASYHFAKYFECKTIELTPDCLFEFIYQATTSTLARRLKHLTIQGYAYSKRKYRRAKERRKTYQDSYLLPYLVKAFSCLQRYSPDGYGLSSLSLRIIPGQDIMGTIYVPLEYRSYKTIWDVAMRTFIMAMEALKQTQMPVRDHLDIFSGLNACSLRYDTFTQFAHEFASQQVGIFKSLKRLSISLSLDPNSEGVPLPGDVTGMHPGLLGRDGLQRRCIRRVLQVLMHGLHFMPELEDLDFHWYNIPKRDDHNNGLVLLAPGRVPPTFHSAPPLIATSLKNCTLRGLFISESDLLHFLRVVCPTAVGLEFISLTSGDYARIIQYLARRDNKITSYYLDDVRKGCQLMHFSVPGEPKYRRTIPQIGPSTLRQEDIEAKESVTFHSAQGDVIVDSNWKDWNDANMANYGGIAARYYNFMRWNKSPVPGDTRKVMGRSKKAGKQRVKPTA